MIFKEFQDPLVDPKFFLIGGFLGLNFLYFLLKK